MTSVFPAVEIKSFTRGDGIDTRISVRAASTIAGGTVDLSSNLTGATLDGITLASGDRILVKNQAEVAQIVSVTTSADAGGSLNNTYFFLSSRSTDYYVWYNVSAAGTDPAIAGRTPIPVAIATNDNANVVATTTASTVNATIDFNSPAPGANVLLITNAIAGYAPAPSAQTTGFTISTSTVGSSAFDNGIWTVGSGAGTTYRAEDLIVGDDAAFVYCDCEAGTVNARTSWSQVNRSGVVGTDSLSWVQRGLFNYSANQLFYANSSSTLATLPTANNSLLVTNGSGVPSFSTALPAGTTAVTPTGNNDVVNKAYVDSTSAGLDPKESVRVRTLLNIGGTYVPAGGAGATGAFTGVDLTSATNFDLGPALVVGNRVLIMNQTDPKQNGIYTVTTAGVAGALERAADQNGTPAAEVSSGNYTFVETGALYASTGWVLQGDGILTLNTDNLNWVQFSSPGSWNGLQGISISGANISTDILANGGLVYNGASPNGQLQVDLGASSITGTVSVANGGTGITSSVARKVFATDISNVAAWRNDVHLNSIKGDSALEPNLITFTNSNASVNYLAVSNSLTAVSPAIAAAGTDTNVSLRLASKGTGALEVVGDTNSGEIRLYNTAKTFYAGIKAAAMASNISWTWPATDGLNGNVMQTNGSGVLSFVNLSASARQILPIVTIQANASGIVLTAVGYFDWDNGELTGIGSAKLFYNATVPSGKTLEIQVYNETTATSLGSHTQTADGFYKLAFTLPVANARLSIRIRKTTGGGANPSVFGASIILNPST